MLIRVSEAAELVGISRTRLYTAIRQGLLQRALKSRGYQAAFGIVEMGVCSGRKAGYHARKVLSQSSLRS